MAMDAATVKPLWWTVVGTLYRDNVEPTHGLRKWFKTRTELAGMKTLFVEKLLGLRAENYFMPHELPDDPQFRRSPVIESEIIIL